MRSTIVAAVLSTASIIGFVPRAFADGNKVLKLNRRPPQHRAAKA